MGAGATPLIRAARTNDVAVMKLLLDAGADPFLTLPDRTNALMIAAGLGYNGVRGEGIRIVVPTPEGAAEAVKLLLDRGMDPDAFNTAGNTAVHGAVGRGEAVIRLLASHGATLNLKNRAGLTPLDLALGSGGRGGRGGVVRQNIADLLRQLQGLPVPPSRGQSCCARCRHAVACAAHAGVPRPHRMRGVAVLIASILLALCWPWPAACGGWSANPSRPPVRPRLCGHRRPPAPGARSCRAPSARCPKATNGPLSRTWPWWTWTATGWATSSSATRCGG